MVGTLMALMVMSVTPAVSGSTLATVPPVCTVNQEQFDFEVDTPARFLGDTASMPHPSAPVKSPANLVQFVVDTNGHVVPNTFLALIVRDSDLIKEARSVVENWKFAPAVQGDCKVPQLVQTPVSK